MEPTCSEYSLGSLERIFPMSCFSVLLRFAICNVCVCGQEIEKKKTCCEESWCSVRRECFTEGSEHLFSRLGPSTTSPFLQFIDTVATASRLTYWFLRIIIHSIVLHLSKQSTNPRVSSAFFMLDTYRLPLSRIFLGALMQVDANKDVFGPDFRQVLLCFLRNFHLFRGLSTREKV